MRIFVVVAILVSVVLLIIVLGNASRNESRDKSNLMVETQGKELKLLNTGATPVTIKDIRINDRDDCTVTSFENFCPRLKRCSDSDFQDVEAETKVDPHKRWLYKQTLKDMTDGGAFLRTKDKPTVLKTGDQEIWSASCSAEIVFVDITTDIGQWHYTFH